MSGAKKIESHDRARAFSLNLSGDEYHKRPELSNSGLKTIIEQTPGHFKFLKENPSEPTAAMITGTIVHSALLEPERFLDTHAVMPIFVGKTKDGKETTSGACKEVQEKREEWLINNPTKVVMDNGLYHEIFGMIGSVMAHPKAKAALQKSHNEMSFFGQLEGVAVRCRPDILRQGNLIADLKTTKIASERGFQKEVADRNYHIQAAFYCDLVTQVTGEKYDTFTIIAVEKEPPYAVQVFALDEATLEKGREEYQRGLAIYKECVLTNKWPLYSNEVVPLNLPSWKW